MRSLYFSKVDYNTKIATTTLQQPTPCMTSFLISLTVIAKALGINHGDLSSNNNNNNTRIDFRHLEYQID